MASLRIAFERPNKIVDGWQRTETDLGVPYYVNHKTERTSWDHPYWIKIIEGLKEYDDIRYAAYRTAMKVRQIQKSLNLHKVELVSIKNKFEEAGFLGGSWEPIHCDDLLNIFVHLYAETKNSNSYNEDPQILADLTLNFLQNLFDADRTGSMKVMSAKLMLIILSSAKLVDKYRFCYRELHDSNTNISSKALSLFLEDLLQLPDFLHESSAFGRSVEPAVKSCCQMGNNESIVSEDTFYKWLHMEPQTIVWLPILHRVATTESVKHDVKCGVCKTMPIIGFRYRCLKCFNFDICQRCFFRGKTRKKHKLKHPIQEYCMNTTTKDNTAAFVKTLKNNLKRRVSGRTKPKYLPVEEDNQYSGQDMMPLEGDIHSEISDTARKIAELESNFDENEDVIIPTHLDKMHSLVMPQGMSDGDPSHAESEALRKQREEFYSIIKQLEEENRALYEEIARMKETDLDGSSASDRPLSSAQVDLEGKSPVHNKETIGKLPTPNYMYPPAYGQQQNKTLPTIHVSNYSASSLVPSFTHTSPGRGLILGDSVDNLDTSPSKFSLPSPSKTLDFGEEEAELAAIVDRMNEQMPGDSFLAHQNQTLYDEDNEMLQAATSVGHAMSEFVSRVVHPL